MEPNTDTGTDTVPTTVGELSPETTVYIIPSGRNVRAHLDPDCDAIKNHSSDTEPRDVAVLFDDHELCKRCRRKEGTHNAINKTPGSA